MPTDGLLNQGSSDTLIYIDFEQIGIYGNRPCPLNPVLMGPATAGAPVSSLTPPNDSFRLIFGITVNWHDGRLSILLKIEIVLFSEALSSWFERNIDGRRPPTMDFLGSRTYNIRTTVVRKALEDPRRSSSV